MTKKLFIKTHGCQMNEYDSAKMFDLLEEKENFELAENEEEADLLILNTCSIREKAQEKVFHQIGRWRKIKDKNPDLKIAIGGCVGLANETILKRGATGYNDLPYLLNWFDQDVMISLISPRPCIIVSGIKETLKLEFVEFDTVKLIPLIATYPFWKIYSLTKDGFEIVRIFSFPFLNSLTFPMQ